MLLPAEGGSLTRALFRSDSSLEDRVAAMGADRHAERNAAASLLFYAAQRTLDDLRARTDVGVAQVCLSQ